MAGVRAEKLYKVFGRRAEEATRRLADGQTRSDVRELGVTAAIIDVSFEVNEGETFVVMGLSGSGKSTLIRMLNGLLTPTSGHVYVNDADITRMSQRKLRLTRQRTMSMVFQHFALFGHRTVLENAAYGLQIQGVEKPQRTEKAREALDLVGLDEWRNHLPEQLSGGMRQRVGLARALAADTDILLMDEAFSALDPLIRRDMQDQLLQLQAKLGKTIIFITHDLNEAMRLGDRIAMMREGRIEQIGSAEQILNRPANDYVARFVRDVDRTRVLTAASVMEQPVATVTVAASPLTAQHLMHDHGRAELFVLNEQRELLGVVTVEGVAEAVRAGQAQLSNALTTDVTAVNPETPIADLFTPAAHSRHPLAVLEANRRLLGVIPQPALLASLGSNPRETEQLIQPAATVTQTALPVQQPNSTAGVTDA